MKQSVRMRHAMVIVAVFVLNCGLAGAGEPAVPDWRGKSPGTAWLGSDVLWRARESLVFHLQDADGKGFRLDVTVRDVNSYQQGERPALLWVVGPSGRTLARELLPDDGIISGNELYRDGISDVYADFRYRQWHREFSPGGTPPGKQRSPYLEHPERIFARVVSLNVPADGPGLYRAVCIGSWDHWFSITPDRPIPTGVHPGAGPLYIHGDRLREAYIYAPRTVKDIGIAVSEEIQPYNWRIALEAENGTVLGTVSATGFYTVLLQRKVAPDAVYRLRLTGTTTGACLHLCGVPAVVCPDAESARLIHGGLDVAAKGRATFHGSQRRLLAWADALTAAELTVAERPLVKDKVVRSSDKAKFHLSDVPRLLASQDLDPASPTYGSFQDTGDKAFEVKFSFWSQKVDDLAMVAGLDDPGNPYRGDPALVRRVLLNRATAELLQLSPFFWFEHNEGPKEYKPAFETFWDMPFRSAWFPMHDAAHVKSLRLLKGVTGGALAPDILAAWVGMYEQWAMARLLMHQGECSNQWAAALSHVAEAMEATGSPQIQEVLSYQVKRIVTPGNLGRVGPEATPFGIRSRIAYTLAADCGYAGAGYLADGLGHDGEYCLETEGHLSRIYEVMPDPGIVRYLNDYYWLKTHLTLPKAGVPVKDTFAGTCSPTDSNHRTRYYTHKTPLSDALRAQVRYGDLWAGKPADGVTWPCLEAKPFVRNVDNEYYFINTPGYYSMVFAGQANYDWTSFGMVDVTGASARFAGYTGMHYGGFGRKATKCAGISTVFVRNCGPTLLSQNHNVMFSNVVWGRRREPVSKRWEEHFVDPLVVCSGYAQPHVTVDETTRVCTRLESIPDVPLQVYRMIVFGHEAIDVRLVLTATGDVDLRELYECLPYYAEKRTVRLFAADFAEAAPFAIPKILVHETREATPRGPLSGENPELPDLNFRAMDIAAASGAGSSVVFDRAYTFRQTQPVRYRAVAAGTGAFNLVLPARYRPGDRVEVRYTIAAHQTAVAPDQLRQIAESAMPANGDSSGARRVPGRSP